LSRDSSVGTETGYGLDTPGFDSLQEQQIYLLHNIRTGSKAHSSLLGSPYREVFPWVKWPRREADDVPPPSTEMCDSGALPPLLDDPYAMKR
jgi:hypothetical protein